MDSAKLYAQVWISPDTLAKAPVNYIRPLRSGVSYRFSVEAFSCQGHGITSAQVEYNTTEWTLYKLVTSWHKLCLYPPPGESPYPPHYVYVYLFDRVLHELISILFIGVITPTVPTPPALLSRSRHTVVFDMTGSTRSHHTTRHGGAAGHIGSRDPSGRGERPKALYQYCPTFRLQMQMARTTTGECLFSILPINGFDRVFPYFISTISIGVITPTDSRRRCPRPGVKAKGRGRGGARSACCRRQESKGCRRRRRRRRRRHRRW